MIKSRPPHDLHVPMIRATLIGYGYSSRTFHAPLLDAVEGLQLVAVVSRNQQLVHREDPSLPVLTLDDLLADPSNQSRHRRHAERDSRRYCHPPPPRRQTCGRRQAFHSPDAFASNPDRLARFTQDVAADHARSHPPRRSVADCEADRGGPRSSPRAGHHPSRPEACQRQGLRGWHGEGAGLRARKGARARWLASPSASMSPTITTPVMTQAGSQSRISGHPDHGQSGPVCRRNQPSSFGAFLGQPPLQGTHGGFRTHPAQSSSWTQRGVATPAPLPEPKSG